MAGSEMHRGKNNIGGILSFYPLLRDCPTINVLLVVTISLQCSLQQTKSTLPAYCEA